MAGQDIEAVPKLHGSSSDNLYQMLKRLTARRWRPPLPRWTQHMRLAGRARAGLRARTYRKQFRPDFYYPPLRPREVLDGGLKVSLIKMEDSTDSSPIKHVWELSGHNDI